MDRIDAADLATLATLATLEFVPPRELTPAQGGVLLTEAVRPEHKVAWLIGAATDGYLDLEGGDGQVTLVRLPRRDGPATYLLDSAFAGRDRLTLRHLRRGLRRRLAVARAGAGRLGAGPAGCGTRPVTAGGLRPGPLGSWSGWPGCS